MTDLLDHLSPTSVLAAMDANLGAYFLPFWPTARRAPARRLDADLVYERRPGRPLQRRGAPMMWHVGPTTRPDILGATLPAHGFTHEENEPGMALDLRRMGDRSALPAELSIEPVADDRRLSEWVDVWGCGAPADVRQLCKGIYRALGVTPDRPWRYYLGRIEGEPVTTVKLFCHSGIVSVHHVVTLPAARNRERHDRPRLARGPRSGIPDRGPHLVAGRSQRLPTDRVPRPLHVQPVSLEPEWPTDVIGS